MTHWDLEELNDWALIRERIPGKELEANRGLKEQRVERVRQRLRQSSPEARSTNHKTEGEIEQESARSQESKVPRRNKDTAAINAQMT